MQLSDKQAQAILEMRLQRLTGLERDKILQEYADILRLIARPEGDPRLRKRRSSRSSSVS
ncbi:MAG: hypothetical protein M0C28_21330 [Candidatus Moduliflexus flocculans]|nr:hypothetical protein [Candidatus Moduliflexus flocculans]